MRDDVIRVVEAYLNGLVSKDFSNVALHPDLEYQGPLGWIKGATIFRAMLSQLLSESTMITGINVERHIVDGEWCATALTLETSAGPIHICDCFRVVDGQIVSIRVYHDPFRLPRDFKKAS